MSCFPIPLNEAERLQEVRKLSPTEGGLSLALNEVCKVASTSIGTPIALVSLVGEDELIFAGKTGIDGTGASREAAFCAHTVMSSDPFIVQDADKDPRFCDNPLVTGAPGLKAYLGVPLETSAGVRIGALCAMDKKPHAFSRKEVDTLQGLGRVAVSIFNSHRTALELDEQLRSAIALQTDMMPSEERIGQLQTDYPLDLSGFYKARDGLGGDIWSVEATGPNRVLIYVADFSGHGVAAALNTARFHSFLHLLCQRTDRPAALLKRLNRKLNEVLPAGQFATMFCATMDFKAEIVEYSSAGAPPQILRRSTEDSFELLTQQSYPLGIVRNATYVNERIPFGPGGALVLYSDGVTETPRPPHSIYTSESLKDYCDQGAKNESTADITDRIVRKLFNRGAAEVHDDIALIVAKHTGAVWKPGPDFEI